MGKLTVVLHCLLLSAATISALDRNENEANSKIALGDSCYLPAAPGFCLAYLPSFYYDAQADRCKSFVYGGCGGNSNRFDNEKECGRFRQRCLRKLGNRNRRFWNVEE